MDYYPLSLIKKHSKNIKVLSILTNFFLKIPLRASSLYKYRKNVQGGNTKFTTPVPTERIWSPDLLRFLHPIFEKGYICDFRLCAD
jgi:hypothetical protein